MIGVIGTQDMKPAIYPTRIGPARIGAASPDLPPEAPLDMRHSASNAEQGGSAMLAAMCGELDEGTVGDGISLDKNIEDREIDA